MNQIATITDDQMPATYQRARTALAECAKVDECKDWIDKAMALAAYAKQANDDALLNMANRIKARAVIRAGELFNQIEPQDKGGDRKSPEGRCSSDSRAQAARDAGWSQDQRKQAQTIASYASENVIEVELLIESEKPPTLTDLARRARGNPEAMRATTSLIGELKRFALFCQKHPAATLVDSLASHEKAALMAQAHVVVDWLTDLAKEIE